MQSIFELIQNVTGLPPDVQIKIFNSVLIIFFLGLVRHIVLRIVWQKSEDPQYRYKWQKASAYTSFAIGLILVARVWFVGISSLTTFLGLITAGLAIALQDLVKSIAGWMFLMWRRPFMVGDRIEIGQIKGDVIDIRLFKFTLAEIGNWVEADQSTGRILHLPNSMILSEKIANYSQGFDFIWHEVPVLITFESNWKKAKKILLEIAKNHTLDISQTARKYIKEASKKFLIYYRYTEPIVYTTVRDSGVLLTIRYLVNPRHRRGVEEAIWEDILDEFGKHPDIDLAYPTIRYFDNSKEGKISNR
jgi:small-conductance mechanosensitive channel